MLARLLSREHITALCRLYMRRWHRFTVEGRQHMPPTGPALLLGNHVSYLDMPALLAADLPGDLTMLALASLFRVPLLGYILRQWDAIPVARRGRDTESIARLLSALRRGQVVAVSVEGIRSRDGRLGPVHPVLATVCIGLDVPLIPVAIIGSHAAMPYGAFWPRRRPIVLRIGPPFRVPRGVPPVQAAGIIRDAIARLLPAEQQPPTQTDTRGGAGGA